MSEDKSVDTERRSGGKRLMLLVVELVLLIISALLIGLFLFTAELKRPEDEMAGETIFADRTPLPVAAEPEPLSDDIPYSRRSVLQAEMAELMDKMRFRMEHTQLEDIRWVFDGTTPDGFFSDIFHVYLGQSDGSTWGRLVAGYTRNRQIFLKNIVIDVDGTTYDIEVDFNDRDAKGLEYIGSICEYADMPMWPYMDALRHVGNGTVVTVSLQGKGGSCDFRLTYDQIDAVKRVVRLYLILQELESSA